MAKVIRLVTASDWGDVAGNNHAVSDPSSNDFNSNKLREAYDGVAAAMQGLQLASLEELQGAVEFLLDAVMMERRSKGKPVKNGAARIVRGDPR
jgi:hypothetical protein